MDISFPKQGSLILIPIGGITDLSTIDYPDHVSMVLYTLGCNLRCPYCHNYKLLDLSNPSIPLDRILGLIEENKLIDAIVISGGEPTIHGDELIKFIKVLKKTGKLIKLDTNGTNPKILEQALPLIDFVAMDIKTSPNIYEKVFKAKLDSIKRSIRLIINSDIPFQFRCTLVYPFVSEENIYSIRNLALYHPIKFQRAKLDDVLDPHFPMCKITEEELSL